jgi:hypothetical protein
MQIVSVLGKICFAYDLAGEVKAWVPKGSGINPDTMIRTFGNKSVAI